MRKRVMLFLLILAVAACLSGCYQNEEMYEQENANRVASRGTEMMQDWLDENMPDATLEDCTAVTAWTRYDGNNYLTEYASGQISRNGETKVFTIHTVTGSVYFETDTATRDELNEIAEAYFDERLAAIGLVPESTAEGHAFECYVMAPIDDVPWVYSLDFGLPAGVEDLETFVRDPRSRLPIYISKPQMTVSDTTDLSCYDLAGIEQLEAEYGLHIGSMPIENSHQYLGKADKQGKTYVHLWEYGCWLDGDGFELRGRVYEQEEARDMETKELIVSVQQVDPETDLEFEETEYGYRLSLMNRDLAESLSLRAHAGADILKYDYYLLEEEEYSPKEDPSEKGREGVWMELSNGLYLLVNSSDHSALQLYDGDILVRKTA